MEDEIEEAIKKRDKKTKKSNVQQEDTDCGHESCRKKHDAQLEGVADALKTLLRIHTDNPDFNNIMVVAVDKRDGKTKQFKITIEEQ